MAESIWNKPLPGWAREGRIDRVREALGLGLGKGYGPLDVDLAFCGSCEAGQSEVARELAPAASSEALSRGSRLAMWSASLDCWLAARDALNERGAKPSEFDMALGLKDVDIEKGHGALACARDCMALASEGAKAWALREHIASGTWKRATALVELGASMDGEPEFAMVGGSMLARQTGVVTPMSMTPRQVFELKKQQERALEAMGKDLESGASGAGTERRRLHMALFDAVVSQGASARMADDDRTLVAKHKRL